MPARGIPGIYATRGHFLGAREGHSKHAARGRPMSANGPEHIVLHLRIFVVSCYFFLMGVLVAYCSGSLVLRAEEILRWRMQVIVLRS